MTFQKKLPAIFLALALTSCGLVGSLDNSTRASVSGKSKSVVASESTESSEVRTQISKDSSVPASEAASASFEVKSDGGRERCIPRDYDSPECKKFEEGWNLYADLMMQVQAKCIGNDPVLFALKAEGDMLVCGIFYLADSFRSTVVSPECDKIVSEMNSQKGNSYMQCLDEHNYSWLQEMADRAWKSLKERNCSVTWTDMERIGWELDCFRKQRDISVIPD